MSTVELADLFPHLAGVCIESAFTDGDWVHIQARAEAVQACCPGCGQPFRRVHSRYQRRIHDPAIGGRRTMIHLTVRRFFCHTEGCSRKVFSEQVAGLTVRHARHSVPARQVLHAVALALGGRPGARLSGQLAVQTGRMTLLRLIRGTPEPVPGTPSVLGVDDFALRRGHLYATILIDLDRHRPIDVLPDREAGTLADWLRAHPGVQIVCRDRASAYAEGVRAGAPDAVQVADRWHLWHNLAEAVEKTVIAHRGDLADPEPEPPQREPTRAAAVSDSAPVESRLATRTRERHAAVQDLLAEGMSISAICRGLGLDRKTVQRFARAETVDELLVKARNRGSLLDPFKAYLHEQFNAGHTDAARLTEQITAIGCRGSDKTVRRYLQPFRDTLIAPPAKPIPPTVRKVTSWLTRRPEDLTESQALRLKNILHRSPALQSTHDLVRGFATLLTQRQGQHQPAWMDQVAADGPAALRSFAAGLRNDLEAVTAGLTLPHSSGPVEGHVNRIKAIKRQMYRRANFDLLRKRIPLTTRETAIDHQNRARAKSGSGTHLVIEPSGCSWMSRSVRQPGAAPLSSMSDPFSGSRVVGFGRCPVLTGGGNAGWLGQRVDRSTAGIVSAVRLRTGHSGHVGHRRPCCP